MEWLRDQWRDTLGIETTWTMFQWAPFVERMGSEEPPDLWIWGWAADYPDPDNFLRVGFPWEETGWRNGSYDSLVEEARHMMDQGERMKLYRQADRVLVQEAAIMPFSYTRKHSLVKPWVRKYPASAVRWSAWMDVILEPH
jgi:ABC-type oligopeptide transport system substrate-binding subunit